MAYRALIHGYLFLRGLPSPVVISEPDRSYFHYLVPLEGSKLESRVGEWQGRLVAFERAIKYEAHKNAERSKRQLEVLEDKIEGFNERMNRLETAMGQTLQKLDRIGP